MSSVSSHYHIIIIHCYIIITPLPYHYYPFLCHYYSHYPIIIVHCYVIITKETIITQ